MRIICLLAAHLPVQIEQQAGAPDTAPLIVGGRPWDPGAVLDCSPAAISAGVRLGMRLARAAQVCPGATFVPAREAVYREAHAALEAVLRQHTDRVETAGLGYLFADVSDLRVPAGRDPAQADVELSRSLAREAQQVSPLDARIGLAPQRFTAEQAARAARPHGWCPVQPGQERTFLFPLPIDPEMRRRLHLLGITTLGTLAALPRAAIVRQFGADAGLFHDLAAGRDPRGVYPDAPPLVVERSHQCEPPLRDAGFLIARVARLGESAATDLAQRKHQAQGMTLTLEDETRKTHIVSTAIEPPTDDVDQLKRQAVGLAMRITLTRAGTRITLTLYPLRPAYLAATQLALFSAPSDARGRALQETLRRLRQRFGELIIIVASLLAPPGPRAIQTTLDADGQPLALVWDQRFHPVARVYEHWRERRRWWTQPVLRDYYRVELRDRQVKTVFRDLASDGWYLERRWHW
jgi:nucleotidyltransferase/DNA polymerase involved in DNA repair